jgi:hypothetical protein
MDRASLLWSICIAVALFIPVEGHAADYLSCDKGLKLPDCTDVVDNIYPVQVSLHLTVSCQVCTGGGGSKCTSQPVDAADLHVETMGGNVVAGSFTKVGACSDVPLFKFGGTLAPWTDYRVVADIGSFGPTALIEFKTSKASTDSGPQPKPDSGTGPLDDGGSSTTDGGVIPKTESGVPIGGDAESAVGSDDDGCSCRLGGGGASRVPALLCWGLIILVLLRRRR